MKVEAIQDCGKTVANIYLSCPDGIAIPRDRKRFVSYLSKDIPNTEIGYAGFITRQKLYDYLSGAVFEKKENENEIFNFSPDEGKTIGAIKQAVVLCSRALPGGLIHIFVFPTFSKFVKEEMSGTTGYTPWKNTTLVFINHLHQQWEKALSETVGHEFNHAAFLRQNTCESVLDFMIFEGLAEHFREQTVGGKRASWTKVLNPSQSSELFLELQSKDMLGSTDKKVYRGVFFGNKKYPLWTGYTIGYYIVDSFFKHHADLTWRDAMAMRPKQILEGSSFLKSTTAQQADAV